MKDKNYFIDETVFEKDTELLKGNFGKDYFLNIIDGGREVKVFVYQLSKFLISEKFPLFGTDETINGKDYIPIYSENYFKGKEYFLNNFSATSDTIFKNPEPYIKNLHYCYYHAEPISGKKGWEYYEHNYPFIINKKTIADYGFFGGILFELKQLQKKYSTLFKDFESNCPLELPVKNQKTYSHRVHILANQYKAYLDIEPFKHTIDWNKERGEKARQAAYTLSETSKNYKPPTIEELMNVIEFLKDFPEAQKFAINKKEQLERL